MEDLTLVEDNKSEGNNRGFAFLEFSSRTDAMDAFKRLQKRNVTFGSDRPAKVSFADSFIDPGDEVMAQVKCWDLCLSSDQDFLVNMNWVNFALLRLLCHTRNIKLLLLFFI